MLISYQRGLLLHDQGFFRDIRWEQPSREVLTEYFEDRHWKHISLEGAVARGMQLASESGHPFSWLTCTNRGSAEVCKAAVSRLGIDASELETGYAPDPQTKSDLGIVAKPGIIVRLSRNFDKQRGFVNGAMAVVCKSLRGNAVFTAKLVGTGNMVLVHPIIENGCRFLPCCYGYATTIRRAQGADLMHGCLYFDQMKRPAARGYAYVGCSRFKTRGGCYVYGKIRRSDFLPAGEEKPDEVLERGYHSVDSEDNEGCGLEYACQKNTFFDLAEEEEDGTINDLDFGEKSTVTADEGLKYAFQNSVTADEGLEYAFQNSIFDDAEETGYDGIVSADFM